MDNKLKFDHTKLSIILLRNSGIKTTKEIEEIFTHEWHCNESYSTELKPLFIAIGFTSFSKALKIAFTVDEDVKIITLAARIATIKEIKYDFCHCR